MTGSNFTALVRFFTKTDTVTLPNATLVTLANAEKDDLAELIVESAGEDYFLISHLRDLVAGQREYTLPDDILVSLKRVYALFDGEEWKMLTERDKLQVRKPLITEENITTHYNGLAPEFDLMDRGIKIFSESAIADVTEGLQLDAMVYPSDITADTLSVSTDLSVPTTATATAMPRASHKVWALRTSIAYKQSRPKTIPLSVEEKNIEFYIQRMIEKLRGRNIDRSYVPLADAVHGDYGYDY